MGDLLGHSAVFFLVSPDAQLILYPDLRLARRVSALSSVSVLCEVEQAGSGLRIDQFLGSELPLIRLQDKVVWTCDGLERLASRLFQSL